MSGGKMMLLSLALNYKRHKDLVCSEIMLVTLMIWW